MQSRIFYRRALARSIARDVVSSAITAGVSTMWAKPEIAQFAVDVAHAITQHLQRLEEGELSVH